MCRPSSSRTWSVFVLISNHADKNRQEQGKQLLQQPTRWRRSSPASLTWCSSEIVASSSVALSLSSSRSTMFLISSTRWSSSAISSIFLTIININNYLVNFMQRVNAIVDVTCLNKNQRSYLLCDSRRLSSFCNVATSLPKLQDCNVITIVTIWGRLTRKPWNQLQSWLPPPLSGAKNRLILNHLKRGCLFHKFSFP